jgi:hypothetical protein
MKKKSVTFKIECEMEKRWVPQFLAMLKYMQQLGSQGASRKVTLYSDGDGDFRPKFKWDASLPSNAKPFYDINGDRTYDAG